MSDIMTPESTADTFGTTLSRPTGTELLQAVPLSAADEMSIKMGSGEIGAVQTSPAPQAATATADDLSDRPDTFALVWAGSTTLAAVGLGLYAWLR